MLYIIHFKCHNVHSINAVYNDEIYTFHEKGRAL